MASETKTIYTDVYDFNVIDEIKRGSEVYVVDRFIGEVLRANTTKAEQLIEMVYSNEDSRYNFWKLEEVSSDA